MGPINDQVISGMEKQSEVLSDGYGGYNKLKEVIGSHLVSIGTGQV